MGVAPGRLASKLSHQRCQVWVDNRGQPGSAFQVDVSFVRPYHPTPKGCRWGVEALGLFGVRGLWAHCGLVRQTPTQETIRAIN